MSDQQQGLDPGLTGLRELMEEYGAAHGLDAWVWQRSGDTWRLAAGMSRPTSSGPGEGAVPISYPTGPDACLEVAATDPEDAHNRALFLAQVAGRSLRSHAQSRFFGREIAERYEEITLLYTISEILGSVISLEQAAQRILREVTDTLGVVRAALWIHDPERNVLELVAAVGGEILPGSLAVDDDTSVTAAVFRERRSTILEQDDVFPRHEGFTVPANRDSFLAVPVSYTPPHGDPRTIGVINLVGRKLEDGFSAGDQKLIAAIASQIGAAVENSRLVAESLRQERLVREMELAHDLQLKLLPSVTQFRDRADVAARCDPAESVGGDFYHLIRLPANCIGVMIGDVSSHGFSAALIMALTMSAVAIHASEADPPAEVLRRVHRTLTDELETTEMYMTLFYGVIDPDRSRLSYANAGHQHAFRISRSGEVSRLPATSPPLGLVDPESYREETTAWARGSDLLFLFTDGLADSLGPTSGETLLVDHVVRSLNLPLHRIIDSLFALDAPPNQIPSDDRTAVLVRA
jgi:sigma-B regulation protein RsbU (phosphoserine phosphatase)